MSRKRKDLHRKHHSPKQLKLQRYYDMLLAAGMEEREASRAVLYAGHYGFDAMTPPHDECVVFAEPTCENWNCLSPTHQVLVFEDHGSESHEHLGSDR